MPSDLERFRNSVHRFIKAEDNALEKCTKGCKEVCYQCLEKELNYLINEEERLKKEYL